MRFRKTARKIIGTAATAMLICGLLLASPAGAGSERSPEEIPRTTLIGRAVLPAATWSEGPPCGEFDNEGNRYEKPRFPTQPVQGFSSIRWLEKPDRILVLTDNGFGGRANSPDYLLRIYRMTIDSGDGSKKRVATIDFESYVQLDDRDRKVPFRIINEMSVDRLLTGADFDPESMELAADGSFWIGDEFGPFLLHFGADGNLLEAPYPIEIRESQYLTRVFRSPQSPTLLAKGAAPEFAAMVDVALSGGFEGLAISADGKTLFAMLEKGVLGDPYRTLRIFEFDLESRSFNGAVHLYRLSGDRHRVGELTHVADSSFLVIERDAADGELARFKRVFRFDLEVTQENGSVEKTEVADLLAIQDPDHLASNDGLFTFPFVTIESIEIIDKATLLIANDNNFDTTGARGEGIPNDTEVIWVRLAEPLQ
jgi:hypothetical protein